MLYPNGKLRRCMDHQSPCFAKRCRGGVNLLLLAAIVVLLLVGGVLFLSFFIGRGDAVSPGVAETRQAAPVSRVAVSGARQTASGPLPSVSTPNLQSARALQQDLMDPVTDGWESEAFNDRASKQLKKLGELLTGGAAISAEQAKGIIGEAFRCGPLRPSELAEVFRDQAVVVQRAASPDKDDSDASFAGAEGFARALADLAAPLQTAEDLHFKFKVIRVDTSSDPIRLSSYYEVGGTLAEGALQQNAVWDMTWTESDDGPPRLRSVTVRDYEEVHVTSPRDTLLVDCTESVFSSSPSFQDQLRFGANHWLRRLESNLSPRLLEAHGGLALGDVNGDELDDVYICQAGGLPNLLFVQQPDGTVRDVSRAYGVDMLDWSYSALFLDVDNDGDQDLAVLTGSQLVMFANTGNERLELKAKIPASYEFAMAAADYDTDGDLDLYLCNYFIEMNDNLSLTGRSDPMHNSNLGGRNALLRNDGDWKFTDVTEESGLDQNNRRWSYAAAWEDYDNDGDQDIYVANDFGHNNLYRNDGGKFVDVADQSDALDANFGMSATWGDYNRDGWMDLYVSNMFSSAGNRVTAQPQFKDRLGQDDKQKFQILSRGNTLLRNDSQGGFEDVSASAGVTMGRWAWASLFTDINNDGWEDLLVGNGYLTQDLADDL